MNISMYWLIYYNKIPPFDTYMIFLIHENYIYFRNVLCIEILLSLKLLYYTFNYIMFLCLEFILLKY